MIRLPVFPFIRLQENIESVFIEALYEPEKMIIVPELVVIWKFGKFTCPLLIEIEDEEVANGFVERAMLGSTDSD